MIPFNRLRAVALLSATWMIFPAGSLNAHTRKGDKLLKLGTDAEARKNYDKALEYFQAAMKEDPKEATYELSARRARFEAGTAHVDAGKKLQAAGDLEK